MRKLLALDVDGTLIGKDLTVSDRVAQAIAAAQQRGVKTTLVTGRMFKATLPFARALQVDAPVICYQGAVVYDVTSQRMLRHTPLANAAVKDVLRAAKADGMYIQLYSDDRYYVESENAFSDLYASLAQVRPVVVESLDEYFATRDATKAVVIDSPERAGAYAEVLRERFGGEAYITRSYPEFIEILNPAVDKGEALHYVASHLGIAMRDVVAIGDSWNDAPLLRAAGFGVAMGSAPPELLEVADAVVSDVGRDGVAEAIEAYLAA